MEEGRRRALRNCSSFENREKRQKKRGENNCIHHCTLILIRNEVCGLCQTVATGSYGKEMGFGNRRNKSRLSVSTAQVQTPVAVAGGDALAGRELERPPQRKTRRALSEKLA
ncbi:hypothetical protein G5714_024007 [Onychostoma macrolepis]|uniref:Uncharacterized protein n=1 Tax=Onychostoma macrolepis TaxID=369639 RepID=A0A7J6BIJ4_9TELE|nr:hypothetical protein G5714_024007 [Onychostoma macrolepis]